MKIIIADDHEIVRRGLEQLIGRLRDWSVTAVASADELVRALRADRYDVVVLDVSLADRSGIELLPSLRAEFPQLRVLMLSMYDEEQYAIRCLRAGASGYVQKDRSGDQILEAIARVASGRRYISPEVAESLAADAIEGRTERPHDRLSDREFESVPQARTRPVRHRDRPRPERQRQDHQHLPGTGARKAAPAHQRRHRPLRRRPRVDLTV